MADGVLFIEGWETDTTASVWEDVSGMFGQANIIHSDHARTGAYGYGVVGSGYAQAQSPLWVPTNFITLGFAFRWKGQGGGTTGDGIFELRGPGDVVHVTGYFNTQNVWGLKRPDGTFIWSTRTLDYNAWYYIEVQTFIHNSVGSMALRINGGPDISVTGVDTAGGSQASNWYCNQIFLGRFDGFLAGQGPTDYAFDDIYVRDANVNAGFFGDVEVLGLGLEDDSVIQFSRSGGTKNYENVDDPTPDEDATYVFTNVDGHQDLYVVADSVFAGTIHAVQLVARTRKTATQIWTINTAIKLGVTTSYGTTRYMAYPTYETLQPDVFGDAPGSSGWTLSQLNAMVVGFKVNTP